jgi:hypothetical protein
MVLWRWRLGTKLHGVTSHTTLNFILTLTKTPNITNSFFLCQYNTSNIWANSHDRIWGKVNANIKIEWLKRISWHYSRTVPIPELFGQISGIPCRFKFPVLLSPEPKPTQPLSFFTFSLNCIWPCSAESWLLQEKAPNSLTAVSLALEKLQLRSGQSDREKGAVHCRFPWVLRMRHIEPFRASIHSCLPRSHCSGHIHTCFSTFIPLLSLSLSLFSKAGAFEVSSGSGRSSIRIEYGSPLRDLYARWKVKEEKWQIPKAISVFMCFLRFLTSFTPSFPVH